MAASTPLPSPGWPASLPMDRSRPPLPADLPPATLAGTYLIFEIGGQRCGLRVEHIAGLALFPPRHPLTPLPGTPQDVLGTVSSGGEIIPVIDLRELARLPLPLQTGPEYLVYLYARRLDGGRQRIGALVGQVHELTHLADGEILADFPPATRLAPAAVLGRARRKKQTIVLLALDHLIPADLATLLAERLSEARPSMKIPCAFVRATISARQPVTLKGRKA